MDSVKPTGGEAFLWYPHAAMKRSSLALLALLTLATTLACRAAMNLIQADPTEASPSASPNPPATELNGPSECPAETASILEASSPLSQIGGLSLPDAGNPDTSLLVTYPVDGDQIGTPILQNVPDSLAAFQKDSALQSQSWNLFIDLIPAGYRRELEFYQVITDGPGNVLASVEPTPQDPARWILGIDVADAADTKNLVFTLIHEFGHLLTLNSSQVPPDLKVFNHPEDHFIHDQAAAACPGYFTGEGCSLPKSYINTFFDRYWQGSYTEWQKINDLRDDQQREDRLERFYFKYQDRFVDDYAVTNPAEDIAESWTFFVLSPRPDGGTIADQKILFFYEDPGLVQLRAQILQSLCRLNP